MSGRRYLTRRTFLRGTLAGGAGVAIGLPVLDAMMNLGGTALADGTAPPQRFVLWFWGNGSEPGMWAPAATGPGWTPTEILRGLAPVRDYVSLVSGTALPVRGMNNPHVEGVVGILAGGNPLVDPSYAGESNDWDFMTFSGPSVDELAADLVAGSASYRSIALSVTPLHGISGPGTAVRYTSHRGPYNFNPPIDDPAAVFSMLFGGGPPTIDRGPTPEDLARASVLDAVLGDAATLRGKIGAADRARLELHLEGIRELERRLRETPMGMIGEACALPAMPGTTDSYRARAQLMNDVVAMALACDLTRVVSMEFSSPASHSDYPDIFPTRLIFNGEATSFHEYEHNVGFDGTVRTGLQYFMDVFGDFLGTLARTPEAGATLLDHAMVLGTSEVANGWQHGFNDYPLIVAGRANGVLAPMGTHVRLTGDVPSTAVPFTLLKALGYAPASWGADQFTTSRLIPEILAP
jgi:hypothetical protein